MGRRIGWANWFNVSGGAAALGSRINVVARNPNHLDLFVTGTDGRIYSTWWDAAAGWAGWFNVSGGAAALASPIDVVARYPDHLDLFVTGTDGRIYSTWWHQGEAGGGGRSPTTSAAVSRARTRSATGSTAMSNFSCPTGYQDSGGTVARERSRSRAPNARQIRAPALAGRMTVRSGGTRASHADRSGHTRRRRWGGTRFGGRIFPAVQSLRESIQGTLGPLVQGSTSRRAPRIAAAFAAAFLGGALTIFAIVSVVGAALGLTQLPFEWRVGLAGAGLLPLAAADLRAIAKSTYCPISWRRQTQKPPAPIPPDDRRVGVGLRYGSHRHYFPRRRCRLGGAFHGCAWPVAIVGGAGLRPCLHVAFSRPADEIAARPRFNGRGSNRSGTGGDATKAPGGLRLVGRTLAFGITPSTGAVMGHARSKNIGSADIATLERTHRSRSGRRWTRRSSTSTRITGA